MKHTFIVFGLGLLGATAAHLGWYRWHEPCHGPELECQLVWMKSELKLTDAQFERIRAIHEASSPRLLALAAQVARMRDELAAFERERTTVGQIDFVEFARFVAQRRAIDRECLEATNRLVGATSGIMTAQQRERYLGLIGPALTGRDSSPPN